MLKPFSFFDFSILQKIKNLTEEDYYDNGLRVFEADTERPIVVEKSIDSELTQGTIKESLEELIKRKDIYWLASKLEELVEKI